MIELFFFSLKIAVVAVIYKTVLSQEPVLNWWFKIGDKYYKRWFYKPIWGCEFCIAGQLALWTYVLNVIFGVILTPSAPISRFVFSIVPKYEIPNWSVFSCVIYICLTILNTMLVLKIRKELIK